MQAFTSHTGVVATLDRANVDTDQIIPKQYLKSIRKTGFGEALFCDWRYLADGRPDPAFELNHPLRAGASILVARNNFGCGSSREHAVWAVMQYGFRVVIAPRQASGVPAFADIFRNNSLNNGLLVIELSEGEVEEIFRAAKGVRLEATVDLHKQEITLAGGQPFTFKIDAGIKDRLLKGLDEIGLTLERTPEIAAFEKRHDVQMPGHQ